MIVDTLSKNSHLKPHNCIEIISILYEYLKLRNYVQFIRTRLES